MSITTITLDEVLDNLSEESSPENTDRLLTKKSGITAKRTNTKNLAITNNSIVKSGSYAIQYTDIERTFYLSGASGNSIFTLPPLASSLDKEFLLYNIDSTYELQVKGYGSENIIFLGISQNTIDIELPSALKVKGTSSGWIVINVLGAKLKNISGTLEMVYEKEFTGVTDADSQTDVAHGAPGYANILRCWGNIFLGSGYVGFDSNSSAVALTGYYVSFTATNFSFNSVGTNFQSKAYKVQMQYYL